MVSPNERKHHSGRPIVMRGKSSVSVVHTFLITSDRV